MAKDRPLTLAVGGDSGTRKTTLSGGLTALFGPANVPHVCLDDHYLHDCAARQRAGSTALNPAANDLRTMEKHVWALTHGDPLALTQLLVAHRLLSGCRAISREPTQATLVTVR